MQSSSLLLKIIEDKILEHYVEYQNLFTRFQFELISNLYRRYQSIENGHIVLYFAKKAHQDILRKKDYDLNFDLSLEKFWQNHNGIKIENTSTISIAKAIGLPRETARRKILQLVKQKILNKKNKNIGWFPNEQYKQNYNIFINKEIEQMSMLVKFVCEKINLPYSTEEIIKEIKKNFSFYWFQYLRVELKYLKIWNEKFKDLELLLIFLQCISVSSKKTKVNKISHKTLHTNPHFFNDFKSTSISATSVSEVTGIPRATCIRKIEKLVKLKVILQDNISKRYYTIPEMLSKNLASQETTQKVVKIFSDFFFTCIKALGVSIKT